MALQIHSPSTLTLKPYHHHHHHHLRPLLLTKPKFPIKSQKLSNDTAEPASDPIPPRKQTSPGQGFGSVSSSSSPVGSSKASPMKSSVGGKTKQKGKRERASIIRRSPLEKPAAFISQEDEAKAKEQNKNESAFLLAWLGLGGIILVEGIVLAASGFLPEEWDKFFVKYLYPSFTPTVGLFVTGTVAYGVLKYLQNENLKDQK